MFKLFSNENYILKLKFLELCGKNAQETFKDFKEYFKITYSN